MIKKLELSWVDKDKQRRIEPRILIEEPGKSFQAPLRVSEGDIFDNRLIHGDNLLVLRALEQEFSGKIKCTFIDPPYNTGSAFEYYEDGLEHSIWLGLMRDRLEIIHRLLHDEGSLWITIDDNEGHYLKVLCDEIFGRRNFVSTVIWQKKYAPKSDSKFFSSSHDFVLVYAKDIDQFELGRLPKTEKQTGRYTNRDKDPRGPWKASDVLRNEARDYAIYPVTLPSGRVVMPPPGTSWRYTREKFAELVADNRIWFGVDGDARPAYKRFLSEVTDTIPSTTIWSYDEVGHNDEAKKEMRALFKDNLFDTPKPERLLERVLTLATQPGDLVLDSFAGSGTTGAVAHKMGRRWIMVEMGDHCYSHIIPRLRKVIGGEDLGGITSAVQWEGGGGFRYFELAPSLLVADRWGNPVINPQYDAARLAEAICKLEGFNFKPSETYWWKHGHSTENDFIYVTTENLSASQLQILSDELGGDQTLLICCAAFHGISGDMAIDRWPNLTINKISKMVLSRFEWGVDDYRLNVVEQPVLEEDDEDDADDAASLKSKKVKVEPVRVGQGRLFGEES